MTVSRALNKPELVNETTLETVRRVVERTGYVPNMLAGSLSSRRSHMVAAIVPSITNSIFVDTVQAFTDRLWEAGYQVMLGLAGYPPTREEALLSEVLSRRPDAVYLTGITHTPSIRQKLLRAQIPIVETWDLTSTPLDMLVGFSHEGAGEAVAQYLLGKRFRRLAVISADDERARRRHAGFLRGVGNRRAEVRTVFVPAPSSLQLGRQGLASLIEEGFDPQAVFCSSDLLALGVLEEARARKLTVPDELAIVGFGGLDFTEHIHPALSSVVIDRRGIGEKAAQLLIKRLQGAGSRDVVVDVGYKVVERGTS